tara:strand:+ start:9941 stop:12415 length:2475 start_codon:yes stop_codon:yes gene_type:complete
LYLKRYRILQLIIFLTVFANNSLAIELNCDTLSPDSIREGVLMNNILYDATDSMHFDIKNYKIKLYGDSYIKYEDTEIKANYIEINWIDHTIYASGVNDSTGKKIGNPQFIDNGKVFTAKEMIYNYKSKKGIIKELRTKEGEGYIHGRKVKKTNDEIMYLKKGEYTTCDAEKPHFTIRSNRIKVIPGKKIISGPAYLTAFNIPTPLFLPFGFFPNHDRQSSGILMPSYGESDNLGFFLKDGGYYLILNQKMDIALRADIYTKGSWSTKTLFRYKERYRYNGSINLSYGRMINSEVGLPDYSLKKDFFIRWNHKQDPKANPSLLFSANVNAGTSTYHRNNSYNANDYLSNTFTSSISLNKKWTGTPFNLSVNLRHSQNSTTNKVSLTLPTVNFSMNRIFPFKNLGRSVKRHWYDKIGISYDLNSKNEISVADSLLFNKNTLSEFRNGIKHTIPISTSIKILRNFTLSPRINFNERWYLSQISKSWNGNSIKTDTIQKFTRAHDYSIAATLNTKLYGIKQFKKGKIAAIRHVLTPSINFSYRPDFSKDKYGYYKRVVSDSLGNTQMYSIMQNGIYGSPGNSENGNLNFNLGNIFDMKVRQRNDSTETLKKITILQSMGLSTSYNLFADSLNFSSINLNARTRLLGFLDLTLSSIYDPYVLNNLGIRINQLELKNGRLARFSSANSTIGLNMNQNTFINDTNEDIDEKKDGAKYKIPWNLGINYSITYNKENSSIYAADPIQSLNFSGDIKITPKWKIGFRSGYDFKEHELTYSTINVYRDLHCWEMLFNWIPIGYHKSYTLTIRVKASVLQDLKLEKKKDWIDIDY